MWTPASSIPSLPTWPEATHALPPRIKNRSLRAEFPLRPHKGHNKCRVTQRMYLSPLTEAGGGKNAKSGSIHSGVFVWHIAELIHCVINRSEWTSKQKIHLRLYGLADVILPSSWKMPDMLICLLRKCVANSRCKNPLYRFVFVEHYSFWRNLSCFSCRSVVTVLILCMTYSNIPIQYVQLLDTYDSPERRCTLPEMTSTVDAQG